jgi:hypothetical protein
VKTISRHMRLLLVLLGLMAGGTMGIGLDSAGAGASPSAASAHESERITRTPDRGRLVADDSSGTLSGGMVTASGGGCGYGTSGGAHSACISYSGYQVHPDFYIKDPPSLTTSCGYFTALMTLYVNDRIVDQVWYYNIRAAGRYGPIHHSVDATPNRSQSAYTLVDLWACSPVPSNYRGNAVSPKVYYVA